MPFELIFETGGTKFGCKGIVLTKCLMTKGLKLNREDPGGEDLSQELAGGKYGTHSRGAVAPILIDGIALWQQLPSALLRLAGVQFHTKENVFPQEAH